MKKLIYTLLFIACLTNNSYSQWTLDYLSSARAQLQSARMGDTLYFIAGNGTMATSVVDVYNTATSSWMPVTNISVPRVFTASVGGDSALYVAGGIATFTGSSYLGTDIVDIYKNGTWSTHILPDSFWIAQAVHVGSKILIGSCLTSLNAASGAIVVSDLVYVYDELTDTWSTDTLSQPRFGSGVATDGVIAIFAGGQSSQNVPSNVVDIYNSVTDTWTTAVLSEARSHIGGIYAGGKFYFAGGAKAGTNNSSNVVDIYDGTNWTTAQLSVARAGITPCAAGDKIFFPGGGNYSLPQNYYTTSEALVDIYDTTLASWSLDNMYYDKINQTAIGYGNKVYIAGGLQVSSGALLNAVEIFDVSTGIHTLEQFNNLNAYPNPAYDAATIDYTLTSYSGIEIKILDITGSLVKTLINESQPTGKHSIKFDTAGMPGGIYFISVKTGAQISMQKLIVLK